MRMAETKVSAKLLCRTAASNQRQPQHGLLGILQKKTLAKCLRAGRSAVCSVLRLGPRIQQSMAGPMPSTMHPIGCLMMDLKKKLRNSCGTAFQSTKKRNTTTNPPCQPLSERARFAPASASTKSATSTEAITAATPTTTAEHVAAAI